MITIQLKKTAKGEIILKPDRIILNDKSARTPTFIFLIFPFVLFLLGVGFLYTGIANNNDLQMILMIISGTLLLLIPALTYNSNFKRTNKKEVELSEIKKADLRYVLGSIYIDFHLNNNAVRRVYNLKNHNDWSIIRDFLVQNNIPVSTG